jgi:hypothetical protein
MEIWLNTSELAMAVERSTPCANEIAGTKVKTARKTVRVELITTPWS